DFAADRFGLRFGAEKEDFLRDTLRQRMEASKAASTADYQSLLTSSPEELRHLAAALTVPETYFFRGSDQLRVFRDVIVPDRLRSLGAGRELSLLSAGCATGEEPYTLAMILHDGFPQLQSWKVTALDLNGRH